MSPTSNSLDAQSSPNRRAPPPSLPSYKEAAAAMLLDDGLIDIGVVQVVTGQSLSEVYRRIREDKFPKPIKLGTRCSRWKISEVRRWVSDLTPDGPKAVWGASGPTTKH